MKAKRTYAIAINGLVSGFTFNSLREAKRYIRSIKGDCDFYGTKAEIVEVFTSEYEIVR